MSFSKIYVKLLAGTNVQYLKPNRIMQFSKFHNLDLLLEVALNGQNYVRSFRKIHLYKACKIDSITPFIGSETGGTALIQGDGFQNIDT